MVGGRVRVVEIALAGDMPDEIEGVVAAVVAAHIENRAASDTPQLGMERGPVELELAIR